MPIIDKIHIANHKYDTLLKTLREYAAAGSEDSDFEKKMINILLEMLEIKTEIDILEKVNKHRQS